MFAAVKGTKKEDLKILAEEIGLTVPPNATVIALKQLILESSEYKKDPDFVQDLLMTTVTDRKLREQQDLEEEKLRREEERLKKEEQKEEEKAKREEEKLKKEYEFKLEMARIQAQGRSQGATDSTDSDGNTKRKFTLPKLEFRKFADDVKEWLPFWSQFEHIHKDEEIAPEDKFQYLIQATVVGSRAREVVESFPPTGANYEKAIQSLKSRFGREDILVEVYVRELLKLIITVQTNEKFSLTHLYDKLESYLRALETLGVTTDMNASILYPMVESCFPAEFLKAWNRGNTSSAKYDAKERLQKLMDFLKTEVEGEERISLAMAGLGLGKSQDKISKKKAWEPEGSKEKVQTAAGLLTTASTTDAKKNCIFCDGKHKSSECFSAQKMSLPDKQKIVKEKRCCFACLAFGHTIKRCRASLRCVICTKKHVPVMCDKQGLQNKPVTKKEETQVAADINMSNINERSPKVFMQTLKATLWSGDKEKEVRLLLDSASQKSYILKSVAKEMNYAPLRQEKLIHSLFGGVSTKETLHDCYKIRLRNLNGRFGCNFDALDQAIICENVAPVGHGSWIKELESSHIFLTDVGNTSDQIDVLIGADVLGKLLTGRKKVLSSGLVAVETYLGWTLMGKVPQEETSKEDIAMTVVSMFVKEADISSLWRLDVLGISDPIERKSKQEVDFQTKLHFLETVAFTPEGRYEVCLPWADDKSLLPDNFSMAKNRLDNTTSKLLSRNLYQKYEDVFKDWLAEGIIEEVPQFEIENYGNYLPHHPVIKLSSSTTPIRPVFDASARLPNHPSLNQCLECGPNLIELLPDLLLRFRERKFGVVADIRKAFCQISIRKEDRDFLRFLWWENKEEKKLKVFRHARVVFGVKCSPFLLASVIEYHIENNEDYEAAFRKRLAQSFYVDNVVTSVGSEEELERFILDSKNLMAKGGFDLRGWEFSGKSHEVKEKETHVLGLIWNKEQDTVKIDMSWINDFDTEKVTKRSMLSSVHKVFDPFGFGSPVMLCPKIMLQKAWKKEISWDEEVHCDLRKEFLKWFQELGLLSSIEIPRCLQVTTENLASCTIHTFVDGSQDAYAAVSFLRIEEENKVQLFLLAAKSRVAPLRGSTIPRLELLAAVIGARLTNSIVEAMQWGKMNKYFWSDATTVLAWISRDENWSVFVQNRVSEIRALTSKENWRHVPGLCNPADLPSRGCSAKKLLQSKWWEGPDWLYLPAEQWPSSDLVVNEDEVLKERKKSLVSSPTACLSAHTIENVNAEEMDWYYRYFSQYEKIVRMIGWMLRFLKNCRNPKELRKSGVLDSEDFSEAEKLVVKLIQSKAFVDEKDEKLKTLKVYKDEEGIIRLSTKIEYREDSHSFRRPIVLPSQHPVVKLMVVSFHKRYDHVGTQMLLNLLREHFWILNGRKTVRAIVSKCVVCKRHSEKNLDTDPAPITKDRIKDAAVFEVVGVDLAGPLYLKGKDEEKKAKKAWICIFTCAVYRAVHFELLSDISTDTFLLALRRFVARRGRCSVIHCDNGTNFVGAANLLNSLDWDRIIEDGSVNRIQWKFNPPTASWWGGWWERLIRVMKDLLKRVIGRACLSYEEMITILCDCEAIINSRPLTYMSERDSEFVPLSPSLFLQDIREAGVPDCDAADHKSLNKRIKYRLALQRDLRRRFRSEYLGTLVQRPKNQKRSTISVGDVVLIGNDNQKRINWPLGRVTEIIPGADGVTRLVKLKTARGEMLRPIQRLFPLEITCDMAHDVKAKVQREQVSEVSQVKEVDPEGPIPQAVRTRSGRIVRGPKRLDL